MSINPVEHAPYPGQFGKPRRAVYSHNSLAKSNSVWGNSSAYNCIAPIRAEFAEYSPYLSKRPQQALPSIETLLMDLAASPSSSHGSVDTPLATPWTPPSLVSPLPAHKISAAQNGQFPPVKHAYPTVYAHSRPLEHLVRGTAPSEPAGWALASKQPLSFSPIPVLPRSLEPVVTGPRATGPWSSGSAAPAPVVLMPVSPMNSYRVVEPNVATNFGHREQPGVGYSTSYAHSSINSYVPAFYSNAEVNQSTPGACFHVGGPCLPPSTAYSMHTSVGQPRWYEKLCTLRTATDPGFPLAVQTLSSLVSVILNSTSPSRMQTDFMDVIRKNTRQLSELNGRYVRAAVQAMPQLPSGRFVCTACRDATTYAHRKHLYRHYVTHFAAKPYACTLCGLKVSRADTLRRHVFSCKVLSKCLIAEFGEQQWSEISMQCAPTSPVKEAANY